MHSHLYSGFELVFKSLNKLGLDLMFFVPCSMEDAHCRATGPRVGTLCPERFGPREHGRLCLV